VKEVYPLLTLFFYGTLKRGQANHDRYCRGYLRVEEVTVRGQLYDLPFGYPALVVPEEDIRAVGTADPVYDASRQQTLNPTEMRPSHGLRVFGELFTFEDPEQRLPALDRLEGFDPAGPSPYQRVMIPAGTSEGAGVLAWAYVVEKSFGTYLPGGRWPAPVAQRGQS